MFSRFRKSPRPPEPAKANPGRGHDVRVSFSNAQRTWEEADDLATSLVSALEGTGHNATGKGDWIELEGFSLLPQIVSVEPMDQAGVNTVTTIQVAHPSLVPEGVFEFQHSSGETLRNSLASGFKNWAEFDLPVFLEAQRATATVCMFAEMEKRRLVFGPPVHMAQKTDPAPQDHDFCPCCLLTKNVGAFEALLQDTKFYGIRLFVSRDLEGHIAADCRVNGIELAEGAAALIRYAQSWPDRGYEYRKQYVGIQTRAG